MLQENKKATYIQNWRKCVQVIFLTGDLYPECVRTLATQEKKEKTKSLI